jgi:aryl-alcohol dehydrogenase-like predicted oxidoreductase
MTAPTTDLLAPTSLGRTGLKVGRLGLSASYEMPAAAVEAAFERGMNYLYFGSLRRAGFTEALRNLRGKRDRMVLVMQSYTRLASLMAFTFERGLRSIGYERADLLLLGWWNGPVAPRILDAAHRLRERGLVRHIAVSTHNRPVIARTASDVDVFHVRYNAIHRGAETDVFPLLPAEGRPGLVAFTATSWRKLISPDRVPAGERVPTAGDCYRYVLSHPSVDVCMTGLSSLEQTEHALSALAQGPLSIDELAWMRRVGDAKYGKPRP